MKRKILLLALLAVIAIFCIAIIFAFSADDKNTSIKKTIWFKQIVMSVGDFLNINERSIDFTLENIRKISHLLEYFGFGLISCCALIIMKSPTVQRVANLAGAGLLVAVSDETIQLYSHRSSRLFDVWVDMAGFLLAIVLVLSVRAAICALRRRRAAKNDDNKNADIAGKADITDKTIKEGDDA